MLRAVLSRLLSQDGDGYLIYQLVEGAEPAQIAAERGVSRLMLTEMLRDAIDQLAVEHEDVAYASVAPMHALRPPQPRGAAHALDTARAQPGS